MKKMSKRSAVIVIIAFLLITALCIYTAAFGWGPEHKGAASNIKKGLDLEGGVSITYETDEKNPSASDLSDTRYKLQQRVDQYSTESNVYLEGDNRITVEIPGVTNADEILEGLAAPGSLYFIAQVGSDGAQNYSMSSETGEYELNKTIEELQADGSIVCEGSDVTDASGVMEQGSTGLQQAVVKLSFSKEGAEKFAAATQTAYSNNQTIGIYYDGRFISVPGVNAVIDDGNAIIEGMGSLEEATQIASYIRIGGLKLKLNEIRSNIVGAQLGQEALRTSLIGGAIGLAAVMILMMVVYLVPGVIAAFALVFYTALMLLLLGLFQITLTLPGVAGIILSIGMAVDANVIIYSRISEELTNGVPLSKALNFGFDKAMSAIVDGNVTTIIAAFVIMILGTGTIKGFAINLAIGVVLSMFTALVVSKLLVRAVFSLGLTDRKKWGRTKKDRNYRFVRNMPKFLVLAVLVIAIGIGSMVMHSSKGERALNYSLDFIGGTATTVEFPEDYSLEQLDAKVKPVVEKITGDSNVLMQKVVSSNQVIIKTRTLSQDERVSMADALEENFDVKDGNITTESISAAIGKEIRNNAIMAVAIAVALMLLYIFIRFRDIRFALSAILALLHDVLITLMVYAILRISVGSAFIAVMLTILGYSINSTIVIFDRVRELRKVRGEGNLENLVDTSVNMTLTRSIFTNLTTFISILGLYVVGVSTIKEFTLPMMCGIVAGGLSSVFLTGGLWYHMKNKAKAKKEK